MNKVIIFLPGQAGILLVLAAGLPAWPAKEVLKTSLKPAMIRLEDLQH